MEKTHAELKGIIRQARMNAGLTQEQLAEAIFVSRDKISAFENGRSEPGYTEIVLLSKALRIPVSDFFPETGKTADDSNTADKTGQVQQISRKLTSLESAMKKTEKERRMTERTKDVIWKIAGIVFLVLLIVSTPWLGIVFALVMIPVMTDPDSLSFQKILTAVEAAALVVVWLVAYIL